jgi:hypothetical protein
MVIGYGDDSSVPVPAIFMFVPGMPVVANRNTYPGLKLVNGPTYRALNVVLDKAYPGYRILGDTTLSLRAANRYRSRGRIDEGLQLRRHTARDHPPHLTEF